MVESLCLHLRARILSPHLGHGKAFQSAQSATPKSGLHGLGVKAQEKTTPNLITSHDHFPSKFNKLVWFSLIVEEIPRPRPLSRRVTNLQ